MTVDRVSTAAGRPAERDLGARKVEVEFLYLDLTTCARCIGTGDSLDRALGTITPTLRARGIELEVRRTLVETEAQARALGLVSSPTIRVNGRDIAGERRESACGPCGALCGGETACRVWVYRGREHAAPPAAMIVEAIEREAFGSAPPADRASPARAELPDNLARFFAGRARKQAGREPAGRLADGCCSPKEQASCCGPAEKASCCGAAASGTCGCRAGSAAAV